MLLVKWEKCRETVASLKVGDEEDKFVGGAASVLTTAFDCARVEDLKRLTGTLNMS